MKLGYKAASAVAMILLAASIGLNIALAGNGGAEPGSEQDPIVSKSYVDAAFNQLSSKVQLLLDQNDAMKNQVGQLLSKLAETEKKVAALQGELDAIKSGNSQGGTEAPPTGGQGSGQGVGQGGGQASQPPSIGKAVVNVAVLNVRSKPNTSSSIVAQITRNETLTLLSKSGDWYKVTTSKGKAGYVLGRYVTVKK